MTILAFEQLSGEPSQIIFHSVLCRDLYTQLTHRHTYSHPAVITMFLCSLPETVTVVVYLTLKLYQMHVTY